MHSIPLDIGPIHIVGIGGIGMSGIAEILHNLGYQVRGSDIAENVNVRRLRALGVTVMTGHGAENLGDAGAVVVSSAIRGANPEVDAARARSIPVVPRAEMLAELMRLKWSVAVAGTHGKTTTTSLVAALFEAAGMDPTVINGGIINAWGTNARLGKSDWMIVEADESDGTFTRLPATCAVVTNIDREHLDHYGDFEALRAAFQSFVTNIPFYGFAVMCVDHPEVQTLISRVADRRIVSYGFSPQADVRAGDVSVEADGARFDVTIRERDAAPRVFAGVRLAMFGDHNVSNALAAIAVGVKMGMAEDAIRAALSSFGGVKRRFTKIGVAQGVTIVDDYAHHPVEIAAALKAARSAARGRVVAVMQPHRYSRLRDLFEEFCTCFNDADHVVVANVFAAGENPIDGYTRDSLAKGLRDHGHRSISLLEDAEALAAHVRALTGEGDLVVCLGAGSVSAWANALPERLEALGAGGRPPA